MRKTIAILLFGGLLSNAALALDDSVTVELKAQNNSGQGGTATLIPEGGKTKVIVDIPTMPAGVAQPAHIHLGTCDKLDKAPKWHLEALKAGRSVTTLPVPLDTILKDKTAINVHKSATEAQIYVSCGNIVPVM